MNVKLTKQLIVLCTLLAVFSCKTKVTSSKISGSKTIITRRKPHKTVEAIIDTLGVQEIMGYSDTNLPIYFYYQKDVDDLQTWCRVLFGSAQGVDISYSQCFNLNITANIENEKYPISNLADFQYRTTYAFKEKDSVSIYLKINKNHKLFKKNPEAHPDKLLKANDTIMYPIKLSLINGYVKNKEVFYKNGRVKDLELLVNNVSKGIIRLLDTPLIQKFTINALYTINDSITLKPLTFYKGSKYDDICISEIQHNLGVTAHSSLNKKARKIHLIGN